MEQQDHLHVSGAHNTFDPDSEIHHYEQLVHQQQWQNITERLCVYGRRLIWAGKLHFLKELLDHLATEKIVHPYFAFLSGEIFQTLGQWNQASHAFTQACSSSHDDIEVCIEGWLRQGHLFFRQGHIPDAEEAIHTGYTLACQTDSPKGKARSLHALSELKRLMGAFQAAEEYAHQALEIAQHAYDTEETGCSFTQLGRLWATRGNMPAAVEMYRKGIPYLDQEVHQERADLFESLSWALQQQGEMDEALSLYEQSLALREQEADLLGKALVLTKIGRLLYTRIWHPLKEMAVSSLYNPTVLAQNMEGNSLAFPDVEAFSAVQEKYQQCLTICRPIGYKYGIVEALNALGVLHLYLESKENALSTLSEALAICHEMGDQIGEATTLANMGFVYYYTGKWEQATAHYGKSLQIYQRVGNPLEIAKLHMQFGRIDAFKKDTVSLFTHFFTAHAISKHTGFENPEIQQQILFQRNQLKPKQFLHIAQKAKKHLAEELQPLIDIKEYVSNWDVQDTTVHYDTPKVGRNDPCPCGSGKKHKKCCGR